MNTLIIPLDFSEVSLNAARYAIRMFRNQPTEFIFLSVMDIRSSTGSFHSMRERMEESTQNGLDQAVEEICAKDNYPGHSFEKVIIHDSAVHGIITYAKKVNAKAIVMGTTGATGLKDVFMGSVAAGTVRKANCPVLCIPRASEFNEIRTVGLATDFKLIDKLESYSFLIDLLKMKKAELVIINVEEEERMDMEGALAGITMENYLVNIPHRYSFLKQKDVVKALNDHMTEEEIDLLVMLRHHDKLLEKLFKRSTVEKMAMVSRTPLLSLPESI